MIKKWDSTDIINQYIKSGDIMRQAILDGDYKRHNKEAELIIRIFKFLEKNNDIASMTLPLLFKNENVVIRAKAAAQCLALKIHINEAVKVLEEAANNEQNGIFGFNAKMTLRVWNEQGYLRMYPENKRSGNK